jgi:hypothetical protein
MWPYLTTISLATLVDASLVDAIAPLPISTCRLEGHLCAVIRRSQLQSVASRACFDCSRAAQVFAHSNTSRGAPAGEEEKRPDGLQACPRHHDTTTPHALACGAAVRGVVVLWAACAWAMEIGPAGPGPDRPGSAAAIPTSRTACCDMLLPEDCESAAGEP